MEPFHGGGGLIERQTIQQLLWAISVVMMSLMFLCRAGGSGAAPGSEEFQFASTGPQAEQAEYYPPPQSQRTGRIP